MKKQIAAATEIATYGEYMCADENCEEGEFAASIPPIYLELPACPGCGKQSYLLSVLRRD